jgi:cytochrome c oxidase subunit 3
MSIEQQDKMNTKPVKFVLWLFVLSSVMFFAAFTSAYIVRRAEGNWKIFDLPSSFWFTSAVILLSSATMHYAFLSAKRFNLKQQKLGLWATLILGIVFLGGQYYSWVQLVAKNIHFSFGNPSESFLYTISGLHAAHIIGGLVFIIVALAGAYGKINQSRNIFRMELCSIFWHFIDILWIYLFAFLLLNR